MNKKNTYCPPTPSTSPSSTSSCPSADRHRRTDGGGMGTAPTPSPALPHQDPGFFHSAKRHNVIWPIIFLSKSHLRYDVSHFETSLKRHTLLRQ